jgi:hypothetical protein
MKRECHVRFCEGLGVKLPGATRLVSIVPSKRLNNGQPSLYYRLFAQAQVPVGAHITGPTGQVTAIEFEADLAAKARANLEDLPQAEVIQGDATQVPFAPADLILVSAGASRPVAHWLDNLKDDGLLVLPMTPDKGMGAIFGIRRRGRRYFASVLSPVMLSVHGRAGSRLGRGPCRGPQTRWRARRHASVPRRLAAAGELLAARRHLVSGLGLKIASLTIGCRRMPLRHPGTPAVPALRDSPRAPPAHHHRWRHRPLRQRRRQP